jgi:hypothetical protein
MNTSVIIAIVSTVAAIILAVLLLRMLKANLRFRRRFANVLDADREAAAVIESAGQAKKDAETELARIQREIDSLRQQYDVGRQRFEELQRVVSSLEENLESIDAGLYQPHFTYSDSESYKAAIELVRQRQKNLIRTGSAATCGATWHVGGSQREGERMVKQTEKLILRAFNAESEAAVANVTWNNYNVMQARIEKAFDALNKLGTTLQITLSEDYKQLRLEELRLVFEAAEKKQQEREEQRRQRAEEREEERVQRELQREQDEAAKEETKYQKMLEKAQHELETAREAEREAMMTRIYELEAQVASAHDRKERAIAQAQLTKVGHVYIISNIGAFGEGVLKIGLTRRLDPAERVRELGDASVPFPYDVHAMIYSENAPELEAQLQNHFWDQRLNWANDRKEFFRAKLDEVQAELRTLGLQTELLAIPEAKEYRRTLTALEEKARAAISQPTSLEPRFPIDPFAGDSAGKANSDGT